jgi:hypothetical protein
MTQEGPVLEALTHRLAECPPEFLAEPRIAAHGLIRTPAVVSDLLALLNGAPLDEFAARCFTGTRKEQRNLLRLVQVAAWLLGDPWFVAGRRFAPAAQEWLARGL